MSKQRQLSLRRCQDSTYMLVFPSSQIKIELRVHEPFIVNAGCIPNVGQ